MNKIKASDFPEKPGVYIFKDETGGIIYIGKAVNLKKRTAVYFNRSSKDMKTQIMSSRIREADYIVTKNEIEAFLLENSLIKEHKPRYNIMLKDDKSYPFIMVGSGVYPGVYVTRNTSDKKASYYGPYMAGDAKKVTEAIYKIFRVRQCGYSFDDKPLKRPCIYYDTGICSAPCVRNISPEKYAGVIKSVKRFLSGSYKKTLKMLEKKMKEYSGKQLYEEAARTRDAAAAVKNIMTEQKAVSSEEKNIDVIESVKDKRNIYYCVLNIRGGRLMAGKISVFKDLPEDEEGLDVFIARYYGRNIYVPENIIIPKADFCARTLKKTVFSDKKTEIIMKENDGLLAMAKENIEERIKQSRMLEAKNYEKACEYEKGAKELKEILGLPRVPGVIEGIDISHMHGENTAGSCVVFRNGAPEKKSYRRYRIKSVKYIDDFESIREIVKRRYLKKIEKKETMPDLILIDGGKGQVNSAKGVLDKLGINVPAAGIAKREEEVFLPWRPDPVEITEKARFILMRVRDEAHRFAIAYQFTVAGKKMTESVFDGLHGIGKKTIQKIYHEFNDPGELIKDINENGERTRFLGRKQKKILLEKFGKNTAGRKK
ncbi:MAG: excinuclease ABC subunit UvrC [Candidatus Goldiibacteriota bacterium]